MGGPSLGRSMLLKLEGVTGLEGGAGLVAVVGRRGRLSSRREEMTMSNSDSVVT